MHHIERFLAANPLVAVGLGILAVLCVHNLLRRQVRVAVSLWLLIVVTLFFISRQPVRRDAPPPLPPDDLDVPAGELVRPPGEAE